MAIKILDSVVTPHGLSLANLTASYCGRYTMKSSQSSDGVKQYDIVAYIYYFYDVSKQHLFDEQVKLTIPPSQINSVWDILYGYLKNKYPNNENL